VSIYFCYQVIMWKIYFLKNVIKPSVVHDPDYEFEELGRESRVDPICYRLNIKKKYILSWIFLKSQFMFSHVIRVNFGPFKSTESHRGKNRFLKIKLLNLVESMTQVTELS